MGYVEDLEREIRVYGPSDHNNPIVRRFGVEVGGEVGLYGMVDDSGATYYFKCQSEEAAEEQRREEIECRCRFGKMIDEAADEIKDPVNVRKLIELGIEYFSQYGDHNPPDWMFSMIVKVLQNRFSRGK